MTELEKYQKEIINTSFDTRIRLVSEMIRVCECAGVVINKERFLNTVIAQNKMNNPWLLSLQLHTATDAFSTTMNDGDLAETLQQQSDEVKLDIKEQLQYIFGLFTLVINSVDLSLEELLEFSFE